MEVRLRAMCLAVGAMLIASCATTRDTAFTNVYICLLYTSDAADE